MPEYFGKYRGKVVNNVDPLQMGRVQVSVPAVLGDNRMSWADPCVPYAGPKVGFYAIPPVGANIWVEFEGGKPENPIWSGCFWGSKVEMPTETLTPAAPNTLRLIKTPTNTLMLDDTPGVGGMTLEVGPPPTPLAKLVMDNAGNIEISTATGTVEVMAQGVRITFGAAVIELSATGIAIKNGGMTIDLAVNSVSINNGALEVT
jgi:hypothetical protein